MFEKIINGNKNIIVKDKKKIFSLLEKFKQEGKDKLQVVSDYDRTLTYCFINGKRVSTNVGLLRKNGYLSKDYAKEAEALYNKYYPIEISETVSLEYKKEMMNNWWSDHLELMMKSGMSRQVIETLADDSPKLFRDKTSDLFKILGENNIPLLVFTAGYGDMVRSFLTKKDIVYKNIHVIGNYFKFDEEGFVIGALGKNINSLNKSEASIENPSYKKETENRNNVILLGDFEGDSHMADGIECDNIIKICFLNEKPEERMEQYSEIFDIIILNDGSMEPVYEIIKELI